MRRSRVEIEVILLHIFAVIAFRAGESKHSLLKYRITAVPQRNCKTDQLMSIGDAAYAVFAPPISLRTSEIVRQEIPCVSLRAVVFTHRTPGAFAQVRAPSLPVRAPFPRLLQSDFFFGHFKSFG